MDDMKLKLPKNSGKKVPNKSRFSQQILTVVLIFMMITVVYSLITEDSTKTESISISELAHHLNSGTIKNIEVAGELGNRDRFSFSAILGDQRGQERNRKFFVGNTDELWRLV